MMEPGKQACVATAAFLVLLMPFAFAQRGTDPNAGKEWDPVGGFADGNSASDRMASGGGSRSVWSFPQPLNSDFAGGYESPATIGGITFSRDGRRCGGMFRMVNC